MKNSLFIKTYLFILFSGITTFSVAQKKLPIVHSTTEKVTITESNIFHTEWTLSTSVKPDIYVSGKINKITPIKIKTDIDSLEVLLKPNQIVDFIVLLNNKDTCYTRFESPKTIDYSQFSPTQIDKIPFTRTPYNNIQIRTLLNHKDSVYLHFDTGATGFYLVKEAIKKYLNPDNKPLTMKDISDNTFVIANLTWDHQQIYPNQITAQGNEGLFGWDAFDGKILEINYDNNELTIYNTLPKISPDYEKFEIEYLKEQFRIAVEYEIKNKKYKDKFLFDTGFQKAAMLDKDMLTKNDIDIENLEILKSTVLLNSQNKEIPMRTVNIDKFVFGRYSVLNVPSELNDYNKPTGYSTHFLGSDLIKRFNLIIDLQENFVYLKPNTLFNDSYYDKVHNR